MSYFPLFIQLENLPCRIFGGGSVARRKVQVLLDFGASVSVVATAVDDTIKTMPAVAWQEKPYEEADLEAVSLVVAATSDPALNHEISVACRKRRIPVNVVDQPEDCDFIFPAYQKQGEVVAAFSTGGQSPVVAQYLKAENASLVTPYLGELTAQLGAIRPEVKERVGSERERKQIYKTLLQHGLERGAAVQKNNTSKGENTDNGSNKKIAKN